MIQKRLCSLSTKVNWYFYDIMKVCVMINNMNMFNIDESLHLNCYRKNITVIITLPTIYQNKTKVSGKNFVSFGFSYKEK